MVDCRRCGTCCVAPDISALDKPLGRRCPHLTRELLCGCYAERPRICRAHQPDEVCALVQAENLEERVRKYLAFFGLEEEAREIQANGWTSMRQARNSAPVRRDERGEDG